MLKSTPLPTHRNNNKNNELHLSKDSKNNDKFIVTTNLFDFSSNNEDSGKKKAVDYFDRIDDAIMGGISTSTLMDVPGQSYASWRGVCRTDGGGFCGIRTLPLQEPIVVQGGDGVFIDCRLTSDDEPERRMWKMTLRTDSSRGEIVYQSPFYLKRSSSELNADEDSDKSWYQALIPFSDFKLVRGPRMIPDAPPMNVSGGFYQVGMTMSKFQMGVNMTEIPNFRPGYFELQIRKIGFYSEDNDNKPSPPQIAALLETKSKEEAEMGRPLLLKMLLPFLKLLFSEKANRRKSAMKLLKEKRGMNRLQAMAFGMKLRAKSYGLFPSVAQASSIVAGDIFRTIFLYLSRLFLFYPLIGISRCVKFVKKRVFQMQVEELPAMQ